MRCDHRGVGSRARKKKKSKPQEPAGSSQLDWPDREEGIELTKTQERWLDMFFAGLVFSLTAGGGTYVLLESWILSLVCGIAAAILAVVLVRRGDTIF